MARTIFLSESQLTTHNSQPTTQPRGWWYCGVCQIAMSMANWNFNCHRTQIRMALSAQLLQTTA